MKKLKIKLEYTFVVPDDTEIVNDGYHGLYIINEKHGLKSLPTMSGMKADYIKFDENGILLESTHSYDDHKMTEFLYNNPNPEVNMLSEKTTITLDKEKYQFIS